MTTAREMTGIRSFFSRIKVWIHVHIKNRLPSLVWVGDELDVCVTYSEDPINQDDPERGLTYGALAEIEGQLAALGIRFDSGQGEHGRDWGWDWSLRGPISVTFREKAANPERRKARPKLRLVK